MCSARSVISVLAPFLVGFFFFFEPRSRPSNDICANAGAEIESASATLSARGKSNVSAATRAKAIKDEAEWQAKRARAKAMSPERRAAAVDPRPGLFKRALARDPALEAAVKRWELRLASLDDSVLEEVPDAYRMFSKKLDNIIKPLLIPPHAA